MSPSTSGSYVHPFASITIVKAASSIAVLKEKCVRRVRSLGSTSRFRICRQQCSTGAPRAACLALAIATFWFLFVFPAAIQAQTTDNIHYPETTIDSRMRSQATVDPVSHALQLQIPLGTIPGRGGASIPVNLHYSSKLWVIKWVETDTSPGPSYSTIYGTDYAQTSNAGWNSSLDWFNYPVLSGSPCHFYEGPAGGNASGNEVGCGQKAAQLTEVARMFVRLPDGSTHELRRDTGTYSVATYGTGQLPGIYYAVDGSHLKYDASTLQVQTLYMPDGSRYKYNNDSSGDPLSINYIDRNGNTLTYSYSTGQWTDTLNRTINLPVSGANQLPGFNNNSIPYTLRYQNLGDAGVLNQTNTGGPNNSTALLSIGDRASANNCTTVPSLFTSPDGMCGGDDDHRLPETALFNPTVLYQIVLADGSAYDVLPKNWPRIIYDFGRLEEGRSEQKKVQRGGDHRGLEA